MIIAHRIFFCCAITCCLASFSSSQTAPKAERLLDEKSPYLQRHGDNLVDWHPWGDAAFSKAKALNRPVFLTVGYSTSPWCTKVEQESFMNQEIAAFLNTNFVCVLVDREERPAVDNACVRYLTLVGESPSWPLHVFFTPGRLPLFGASYLSNERDERPDSQTLMSVLKHVQTNWRRDTEGYLIEQSQRDIERMQKAVDQRPTVMPSPTPDAPTKLLTRDHLTKLIRSCLSSYDVVFGGSLTVPKFPLVPGLQWLQQYSLQFAGEPTADQARKIVETTLLRIADGGIRDHAGGGFHRYALDERWRLPSFEKTLYDQALLGELSARLFATTGDTKYKDLALETFGYMTSRLANPVGGFFSSEDSVSLANLDSIEPEHGAFYSWTASDFDAALAKDSAARTLLRRRFGIMPHGNTPPGSSPDQALSGKNVLYHKISLEEAATGAGIPESNATAVYQRGLTMLGNHRAIRPRPMVDKKILASWNGYAIAALARSAIDLKQPALLKPAEEAIDFILTNMVENESGKLRHSWLGEVSDVEAVCDDYAAVVDACLALHAATGDAKWLNPAQSFQQTQIRNFRDPDTGAFFDAAIDRSDIFLRLHPAYDSDLISANALSARNLVRLGKAVGGRQGGVWKAAARQLFAYFEITMVARSQMTPGLLAAWEEFTRP